jgi:predicted NBD/HSP70 family sugar kinase
MQQRGSNLPRVGDYNQVLVVDLVRRHPGISRVELTERTGLSGQTVSNICRRLVDQGLIRQTGRVSTELGARRTVFEVIPDSRCAVGLHIDPARMVLALVDLAGHVMDHTSFVTPATGDPAPVIDAIVGQVRELVDRNGVSGLRLSGLGVASPGPINRGSGAVLGPPNLRGWDVVGLRDELGGRLRVPVELEKDTVAAATGELWAGNLLSQDFAFVYLGTGAGAGVVLGGEVMHGASGNLGNFGHLGGDPDGPRCECGGRGCVASTAMPAHLVTQALESGLLTDIDVDDASSVEQGLAKLSGLAADGNAAAGDILDRAARSFARVVANLTNVLDLDTIVFGGPNWRYLSESFLRIVPGVVDELHLFRRLHGVEIRGTSLGEDVGPIGAASLVLAKSVSASASHLILPAGPSSVSSPPADANRG